MKSISLGLGYSVLWVPDISLDVDEFFLLVCLRKRSIKVHQGRDGSCILFVLGMGKRVKLAEIIRGYSSQKEVAWVLVLLCPVCSA